MLHIPVVMPVAERRTMCSTPGTSPATSGSSPTCRAAPRQSREGKGAYSHHAGQSRAREGS
eukprot:9005732-Pyramimonas_sp.AAC.1